MTSRSTSTPQLWNYDSLMANTPQEYYTALRRWRDSQQLSNNAMGKALGVSHVTVGKWLDNGTISPRFFEKIREVTGSHFPAKTKAAVLVEASDGGISVLDSVSEQSVDPFVVALRRYVNEHEPSADFVAGWLEIDPKDVPRFLAGGMRVTRNIQSSIAKLAGEHLSEKEIFEAQDGELLDVVEDSRFYPTGSIPNNKRLAGVLELMVSRKYQNNPGYISKLCRDMGYDEPDVIRGLLEGKSKTYRYWHQETLAALCRAVDLDFELLPLTGRAIKLLKAVPKRKYLRRKVKVLAWAAAATMEKPSAEVEESLEVDEVDVDTDGYTWRCFELIGSSAEPLLRAGDLVLGRQEEQVCPGDVVVLRYLNANGEWDAAFKVFSGKRLDKVYEFDKVGLRGNGLEVPEKDLAWMIKMTDFRKR